MDSIPLLEIADALRAYADQASPAAATPAVPERRAHVRMRAVELPAPMVARLKHGPLLTLLDVSAGGALIETPARLNPGAHLVLEFVAPGALTATVVPSRVTRSHVASLQGGLRYRGGFSFKHLLDIGEATTPREQPMSPTDAAALTTAIASLRSVASRSRDGRVAQLLDEIIGAVPLCRSSGSLMTAVEQRLRRCLPLLSIGFAAGSHARSAGNESLLFDLGHGDGVRRVHVEFRPAAPLDDGQMRLLHAGVSVMSLICSWPRRAAASL